MDHVTYLDPHDFDQGIPFGSETEQRLWQFGKPYFPLDAAASARQETFSYGASTWANVEFADVYYQTRGLTSDLYVPEGRPIPGAYNQLLSAGHGLPVWGWDKLGGGDHTHVWNGYYRATVLGTEDLNANGVLDEGEDLDGDGAITEFDSLNPNDNILGTGYAYSRLRDGQQRRPAPVFYNTNVTHDQDHEHTSSLLVDSDGKANTAGLTTMQLNEDEVTNARWYPDYRPGAILNGAFVDGGRVLDASHADLWTVPGWSNHGGQCNAEIVDGARNWVRPSRPTL